MNGHWAGTTDEELRAIRERPGDSPTVSEPRTPDAFRDLMRDHSKAELIDLLYIQTEAAARAEAAQPINVPAMAETLRFLYHADQPCDKPDEHRHEYIAAGIGGQYPRIARLRASDTDQ